MAKPKLVPKPPKQTQREIDQATTIDTFRLLLSAMIRKYGTLDTVYLSRTDIENIRSGDLRVRDDAKGIHLAIKVGSGPLIGMAPKLVTH
jgi:hypothetical protein